MILAYLRVTEARSLSRDDRAKKLNELREELMRERGVAAMGGSPPSPGKMRQLRRQIARILTLDREEQLVKLGEMKPRGQKAASKSSSASAGSAKKPKE